MALARPTQVVVAVDGQAPPPTGDHAYFETLIQRPDVLVLPPDTITRRGFNASGRRAIYSLREQPVDAYPLWAGFNGAEQVGGRQITYSPTTDTDVHAQDAAKVVIPTGKSSLRGQDQWHLYLTTFDGHRYLVTWDVYTTDSYLYGLSGIKNQKTFQFGSPSTGDIWLETKFNPSGQYKDSPAPPSFDPTTQLGPVWVRSYNGPWDGVTTDWTLTDGNKLGPPSTRTNPLLPQLTYFMLYPNRWTRLWWLIDQRGNDWDPASFWIGDAVQGVVQLLDGIKVSVRLHTGRGRRMIESMYLEYNTSDTVGVDIPTDHAPFVAYVRNGVVLQDPPIQDLAAPGNGLLVTTGL